MNLQTQKTGERDLTIRLNDIFDFSCVDSFRLAYEDRSDSIKNYIIDFRDTTYMDSSALGMLINLHRYTQEHSGEVKLVNPSASILKILTISRFDKKFTIEQNPS